MVSLYEFKKFARIPTPGIPAMPSTGIVVFTKNPPSSAVVRIPEMTRIYTATGFEFVTVGNAEINESQAFLPVPAQSAGTGKNQDIESNQTWSVGLPNLVVTNPSPFTGGLDGEEEIASPDQLITWIPPDDGILQKNLDLGRSLVLIKLGNPDQLPDQPAIDRSVYLFAQFFTENASTQETQTTGDLGDFKKTKTSYYRSHVWRGLNREVDCLLRPYVDVSKFMPPVPGATA